MPNNRIELEAKLAELKSFNEESVEVEEYAKIQFRIGFILGRLGRYEESYLYFEKSVKTFAAFTLFLFSEIMKYIKDNEKAESLFELFVDLVKCRQSINDLLGMIFDDEYERKLAHYTSVSVFNILAKNYQENEEQIGKFRLNNIYDMNDPMEGNILLEYLNLENFLDKDYKDVRYTPFIGCFTLNHDSLNQFRLYGKSNQKEATGVSLVVDKDFFDLNTRQLSFIRISDYDKNIENNSELTFSNKPNEINKQPVYRCVYVDPETDYIRLAQRDKVTFYRELFNQGFSVVGIEKKWKNYQKVINKKEEKVRDEFKEIKKIVEKILNETDEIKHKTYLDLVNLALLPLKYLIKHSAFQEEQECRICYITSLNDPCITMDFDKKWLYIDYSESVKDHITNVYIATGAKEYYPFIVRLLDGDTSKVQLSKNPFRTI